MLSEQNAFQSYIHLHLHHLCAVVLHCVMHEVFVFTVLTLSSCACLRAAIKITSIIDDSPV
jgi:hypothetical protein